MVNARLGCTSPVIMSIDSRLETSLWSRSICPLVTCLVSSPHDRAKGIMIVSSHWPAKCRESDLVQGYDSVFVAPSANEFSYSEGLGAEAYLSNAVTSSSDLASDSPELESWIRDWSSEYHLSPSRSLLLSGFEFEPNARAIEVGGGCGAITRFLAERLSSVTMVEGSAARAAIARQRTRDMQHVKIIRARFQDVDYESKFDLAFCIGVLEYSGVYFQGDNPFDSALGELSRMLGPNGSLVLAIENQFGLKYFASAGEDHVGRRFEGIEGYPHDRGGVRTFGRVELDEMLARHFSKRDWYYPFPDYKTPSCVLDEHFLGSGDAGELISQLRSRDYGRKRRALWDERLAVFEFDRNRMLPDLSNSFLVVASKGSRPQATFGQAGVLESISRVPEMRVRSVINASAGGWQVRKSPGPRAAPLEGLSTRPSSAPWVRSVSVQSDLLMRAKDKKFGHQEAVDVTSPWFQWLRDASESEGGRYGDLPGEYIDRMWKNAYVVDGHCSFIDDEWNWVHRISAKSLIIRSVFWFCYETDGLLDVSEWLGRTSIFRMASNLAESNGVDLTRRDFAVFADLESGFVGSVYGIDKERMRRRLLGLVMMPRRRAIRRIHGAAASFGERVHASTCARARALHSLGTSTATIARLDWSAGQSAKGR